jgi:membrane protein implicated in regulation of membrane protease activity
MTHEQYWLIAAIVLFILEIVTPGFVLANLGVAAMASAVTAWAGGDITIQVIVFGIVCVISFVTLRPLMQRFIYRNQAKVRTGADAVVGKQGIVTEEIRRRPVGGRIQVGGDNWHAEAEDGGVIEKDMRIEVVAVDSTTLLVRSLS